MSDFRRNFTAIRIATAVVAIASIVVTLHRALPEIGAVRMIAGGVTLAFACGGLLALTRITKRRSLTRRMKRAASGCKLCGLDPAVDDSDEPAPRGRCIECGRVRRL